MTQTLSERHRFPLLQTRDVQIQMNEAKGMAQVLRIKSLLLSANTKRDMQQSLRVCREKMEKRVSSGDLLFLSGVARGGEIYTVLEEKGFSIDCAVFAFLPVPFFTGILLGLSHDRFALPILYLPPENCSKKKIRKLLKKKLPLLRELATLPVVGLESDCFDLFPYYLDLDPLEKQEAKRKLKLCSLKEKSKLKRMNPASLFGFEDIVRFFGREKSYLFSYLAEEETG